MKKKALLILACILFVAGIAIGLGQHVYFHVKANRIERWIIQNITSIYSIVYILGIIMAFFVFKNKALLFISSGIALFSLANGIISIVTIFQSLSASLPSYYGNIGNCIIYYIQHFADEFQIWNNFAWLISAVLLNIYLIPKAIKGITSYEKAENIKYSYLEEYKKTNKG